MKSISEDKLTWDIKWNRQSRYQNPVAQLVIYLPKREVRDPNSSKDIS
jgi:hypothetical protein